MKMKFDIALAAFIGILLLLVSCQKDRAAVFKDPLDEGYQLIDSGNYSQAIEHLQELSQRDFRPQVRVALASAYAARGGIRVGQYWGFVVGFKAPLVTLESLKVNSSVESVQKISQQLKGNLDPRDLKALGDIVNVLVLWERYKDRVEAIPIVSGSAQADVQSAVEILTSVSTPGGRLYRAILNLILFKSHLHSVEGGWKEFGKSLEQLLAGRLEVLCELSFEGMLQSLRPLSYHLMETLADLGMAFEKEKSALMEGRALVQGFQSLAVNGLIELNQKRACP